MTFSFNTLPIQCDCLIDLQVIRFGHDWDPACMKMDEVLYSIAEKVKNFAIVYLVDITEVPDFNKMYADFEYSLNEFATETNSQCSLHFRFVCHFFFAGMNCTIHAPLCSSFAINTS